MLGCSCWGARAGGSAVRLGLEWLVLGAICREEADTPGDAIKRDESVDEVDGAEHEPILIVVEDANAPGL